MTLLKYPVQQCSVYSRCCETSLQNLLSFENRNCVICPAANTPFPPPRSSLVIPVPLCVYEHDYVRALVSVDPTVFVLQWLATSVISNKVEKPLSLVPPNPDSYPLLLPLFLSFLSSFSSPSWGSALNCISQKQCSRTRDFPGCPAVKTHASRGVSVIPGWATKIPHAAQHGQKI